MVVHKMIAKDSSIPKRVAAMQTPLHNEIANLKVAGWWYVLHAYIL